MQIVTVELINSNALRLLLDLELANILRVISPESKKEKVKLSSRLRGRISKERAIVLNKELNKSRKEWQQLQA